jgi:hypothetical protein
MALIEGLHANFFIQTVIPLEEKMLYFRISHIDSERIELVLRLRKWCELEDCKAE